MKSLPLRSWTTRLTPAILILLCVTLLVFHKVDTAPIERLRVMVTDVTTPVLAAVSQPVIGMTESIEGITALRTLKAENIRLKEENAKLLQWYESALRFQAENQSLRDLLNVRADPDFTFVSTRIVSDPGGSFVKSVLLPVGANEKVAKGSAVLSGQGLVGRVTEVGRRSSRVLLLTDLNSRVPVLIQNTRTRAILAGKNDGLVKLERLPSYSGLSVGQRVVTSGDGGQLPPDIPVGTIVKTGEDGVFVQLFADLDRMTYVQVINTDADGGLSTGDIVPAAEK